MRGGHDGARPDIRGDGAIGKSLPYLTWVQSMARALRRTTLRNWLCNLPACANLARVAGLESVTPAAVYHLRGSDSDLSQAPLLLPSSTSLATSSVPSFISCVRQLCYMDVTIQNTRQEILRYLLAI